MSAGTKGAPARQSNLTSTWEERTETVDGEVLLFSSQGYALTLKIE